MTLAGRFGRHLLEFMQMSTEEDAAIATCGESTFNHLFEDSPYFNGLNQSVKSVLKQVRATAGFGFWSLAWASQTLPVT